MARQHASGDAAIEWHDWTAGAAGVGRQSAHRYHLVEREGWWVTAYSPTGDQLHVECAATRDEARRIAEQLESGAAEISTTSGRIVRPPSDRGGASRWLSALRGG